MLSYVPLDAVTVEKGSIRSRAKKQDMVVKFDADTFYSEQAAEEAIGEEGAAEEGAEAGVEGEPALPPFNPLSMEDVARRLPDFKNVRSMLQVLVEDRGHILQLSPKYHAELAGEGVEYCFGRCKWWFRTHNGHSTKGLREISLQSFGPSVVTLQHARKFARRVRDYIRAYKDGARGLEVEVVKKVHKTHRCALDTDYTFCTESGANIRSFVRVRHT